MLRLRSIPHNSRHSLKPGPEIRDLGPVNRDSKQSHPRIWSLRTWDLQMTPTTGCVNFICEANVYNKKLGHVCRNLGIFSFHFFIKNSLTLSLYHIFVAFFTFFRGSCSLRTFKIIETFIYQSQKQNLTFKLDSFWLNELFRLNGENYVFAY